MKKLLLLLLCVPLIGFGQTKEEYFDKAYDYAENGEYQLAIDNFTKCLRIDPDAADAYYNRGWSYKKLGNYEDAISDFTRAIRIDPAADAYVNRGLAYYDLGNYEEAISDYTRAIRIDPDYDKAYRNRGLAKAKLGKSSCSDYKRACNLGDKECCRWYKEDNCR